MSIVQNRYSQNGTPRLIVVFHAVVLCGPITLPQLTKELGIPRASIWRALDRLRQAGWIRMRLGDNAFEVSHDISKVLANANATLPGIAQVVNLLSSLGEVGNINIEIGMFTDVGRFEIVETTQKTGYSAPPLSLTDDLIAIAGQLALPSSSLLRHVSAFLEVSNPEEHRVVTSGEHNQMLRDLKHQTVIWNEDNDTACLPMPCAANTGLAVQLELKIKTKRKTAAFMEDVDALSRQVQAATGC